MKKISLYTLLIALSFWATGCSLETDPYSAIPSEDAFRTTQDVQNGMHGAYNSLGDFDFLGNYALSLADMASDISLADNSSGNFVAINLWNVNEDTPELSQIWTKGYEVIDRCTRGINGANALLSNPAENRLTAQDITNLNSFASQMYAMRSLSSFIMVNIFGLPYRAGTPNSQLGIVLVDLEPIPAYTNVLRSTVAQTYTQILKDIASAKTHLNALTLSQKKSVSQYYLNEVAVYALEARVKLYMQDYAGAKTAAQTAIDKRASGNVSHSDYVQMWTSTAITDEDIFTVAKSEADNLSANSINTLYNSYGGSLSEFTLDKFADNDIRKGLLDGNHPRKFDGNASSEDVGNIPIFRKSEMYLIIAEASAQQTQIADAQNALFYTAKRNLDITSATALPSTKTALLTFIADERIREFFQEGHRMYDLRRTGAAASISGNANYVFATFVYPIPANEINSGFGVVQNPNWSNTLP